jgi:hypothetical protein
MISLRWHSKSSLSAASKFRGRPPRLVTGVRPSKFTATISKLAAATLGAKASTAWRHLVSHLARRANHLGNGSWKSLHHSVSVGQGEGSGRGWVRAGGPLVGQRKDCEVSRLAKQLHEQFLRRRAP